MFIVVHDYPALRRDTEPFQYAGKVGNTGQGMPPSAGRVCGWPGKLRFRVHKPGAGQVQGGVLFWCAGARPGVQENNFFFLQHPYQFGWFDEGRHLQNHHLIVF
jgi:hypothetical protein